MKPYALMRSMLDQVDRDIVYSLCQYGLGDVWEWGEEVGGNLWRTTGDITDTWKSMSEIGFSQVRNASCARPGNWNDPDMLVVGWVGWGPSLHPTQLTPDEQYTHISLWSLLSAPLLIGCDLERLDGFTLNLLTNDEVIAARPGPVGQAGDAGVPPRDVPGLAQGARRRLAGARGLQHRRADRLDRRAAPRDRPQGHVVGARPVAAKGPRPRRRHDSGQGAEPRRRALAVGAEDALTLAPR
jgi:hypothetical protein